jgi:CheY-like chemotaxis protein
LKFARILVDMARERGFKVLAAGDGASGMELARQVQPDAITLDLRLPDTSGWTVLDRLKHDPRTHHIPVHIVSVEEERQRGMTQGALTYLQKPVAREKLEEAFGAIESFLARGVRRLLVVEDDERERKSIVELIGNDDVEATAVDSGAAALKALTKTRFDCVVLDLGLPDMDGFELIDAIEGLPGLRGIPVIVYTGRDLTHAEELRLRRATEAVIVKDVRSPERLLAETVLFLHRVESKLPEEKQRIIRQVRQQDELLSGRKVLIVDDDVRNIFALSSVLERYGMEVSYAENGPDAIEAVRSSQGGLSAVLMDIMMPGMDGYEATQSIRELPGCAKLPIIAVTAKAMKGDRDKCLEAGASDYIAKPVDTEQLLSLLRVWLYPSQVSRQAGDA